MVSALKQISTDISLILAFLTSISALNEAELLISCFSFSSIFSYKEVAYLVFISR